MESNKITIKLDDIFSSHEDAIVIPRSTNGTISSGFKKGLRNVFNINATESLDYKVLGSLDIAQYHNINREKNLKPVFHLLFATCVADDNNSSSYEAIVQIGKDIAKFTRNNSHVCDIAVPLIGTGAGRLDHIEVYKILYETFDELADDGCHLYIYIHDEWVYEKLLNYKDKNKELKSTSINTIDADVVKFKFKSNGTLINNDVVYPGIPFNVTLNSYTLVILPKTRYWRFGIRLSKTEDIEFYHPDNRYKEPDFQRFKDIHIGVGEWDNHKWSLPNRLHLVEYNFENINSIGDHKLIQSEFYREETEVRWNMKYENGQLNVIISTEGVSDFLYSFPLDEDYKYFKIFAWADKISFEIDFRMDISPSVKKSTDNAEIGEIVNNSGEDNQSENENNQHKSRSVIPKLHSDIFAEIDLLNYQLYAEAIVQFIKNKKTHPPLTIGILAPWGKGKTTLMKFIQKKLDNSTPKQNAETIVTTYGQFKEWLSRFRKEDLKKSLKNPTVWFNAWKFQKTEEVWAGFAYEIIHQLVGKLPNKLEQEKFWFLLNMNRIDKRKVIDKINFEIFNRIVKSWKFILGCIISLIAISIVFINYWAVLASIGSLITLGVYCHSILKKVKSEKLDFDISKYVKQPDYQNKMGYFHSVESDLRLVMDLLVNKESPVIIFIDDLDRCSPKMVAEVVEALNLFISGDFPDCYFILGQDAQMVAAALDAAYKDMGARIPNIEKGYGSLGWYFMEKFIQLHFSIPNISGSQSEDYLQELLGHSKNVFNGDEQERKDKIKEGLEKYEAIVKEISMASTTSDLQKISNGRASLVEHFDQIDKSNSVKIQEQIIDKAANIFEDNDDEVFEIIKLYSIYVRESPRMIKRFVNLYRFYRFIQFARLDEKFAKIEAQAIGRWIVVIIRWPQLVRCIQWDTEKNFLNGASSGDRATFFESEISKYQNFDEWQKFIDKNYQDTIPWLKDKSLFDFMKTTGRTSNGLYNAVEVGFW